MNIFRFTFLFFCVISSASLFAQQTIVSGQVIDSKSKENIPFATVVVTDTRKGGMVTGTVGNEAGRFKLEGLPTGEYIVTLSCIGYGSKSVEMLVGELNTTYNLGKIALPESVNALDEIQVTGRRETLSQALDKKTFDIGSNLSQLGGSVLDAMGNLPGISVDQEGKVLLRGSDKVAVLIDGKQSALTGFGSQKGLSTVPVSNIERIEIINNPSAKYDASGMAGIINIIYKKERQTGFNGDAGLSFGLGALTRRKKDLPSTYGSYKVNPKFIPSLNMNYKTEDIHVFLQAEIIRQRHLPNNEFTTREYTGGLSLLSQIPENRMQTHYILRGGIDWQANQKNSLSLSGLYDYENHVDKANVCFFDKKDMTPGRNWQWEEQETTGLANITAHFKHRFDTPGHEFLATVQYTRGWEDEEYKLREISTTRIGEDTTHVIAKEHTTQLSADYVQPLLSGRIEVGLKGQIRRLPVTYDVYKGEKSIIYPGLGDWSDWGEDLAAMYANWVWEKKKADVEIGLRTEYTRVFYKISPENIYYPSNDAYDYWDLFPNVRLTWKINDSNRLSAFYNYRIDRPGEAELRIFPKYDDPELLKVGNPYLRPQYTHNFELAYKYLWKSGSVYLAGYYKIINDPYSRIYAIDEHSTEYNIINKVYENTGKNQNVGMEFIVDQQITAMWKASASVNIFRNRISAYDGVLYFPYERSFTIKESNDNTWYAKLNTHFNIGKNSQLQLSGVYFAPTNIPQGRRSERGGLDIGFRRSFFGDNMELIFSMRDVFNTMRIKEKVSNEGFTAVYENYYETQVATVGIKAKF